MADTKGEKKPKNDEYIAYLQKRNIKGWFHLLHRHDARSACYACRTFDTLSKEDNLERLENIRERFRNDYGRRNTFFAMRGRYMYILVDHKSPQTVPGEDEAEELKQSKRLKPTAKEWSEFQTTLLLHMTNDTDLPYGLREKSSKRYHETEEEIKARVLKIIEAEERAEQEKRNKEAQAELGKRDEDEHQAELGEGNEDGGQAELPQPKGSETAE
ncbi:uncharacterized protein MAM_05500 [Metarhizium album ARSEF 1941]|uniref:Uncharacterized protein n=1 Tax=Metarhizium album (strain ARSEF 1941) TaxID=1081103 RepID=A0A0B2WSU2_METAS|nr:uncharacterized protein MAM_05500 [Metarhizium album ARSEF 1941]KHN96557.1 hypothetical protein MAM_05500 [Metarhizium album ARSEF 1941]